LDVEEKPGRYRINNGTGQTAPKRPGKTSLREGGTRPVLGSISACAVRQAAPAVVPARKAAPQPARGQAKAQALPLSFL